MKPSSGYLALPPQKKINETLTKLLKAADNSASYSQINQNNNRQNQKKKFFKTKSTSLQSKSKKPTFILKPKKQEKTIYVNTTDSPQMKQISRIQTEPQMINSNQSYLNSLIKQRMPTTIENRPEASYLLERMKGKSISTETSELIKSQYQRGGYHRRHKTLLNISNESSINLSGFTSNLIQMPNIPDNKIINRASIEAMLQIFLQSNLNEKNLSVLGYLEKFFKLLDQLQNTDVIYGLIKEIVQLPFRRISEQFESIKGLYKEKIVKSEILIKEKEKAFLLIKSFSKDNEALKIKLKAYEEVIDKMKIEQDILIKEMPKPSGKYWLGIENKVPNLQNSNNNPNFDYGMRSKKDFNEELKQKLRLNLKIIKKNTMDEEMKMEIGKLNQVATKNIIGFHDEFMSKFEEFNTSSKNKALK